MPVRGRTAAKAARLVDWSRVPLYRHMQSADLAKTAE